MTVVQFRGSFLTSVEAYNQRVEQPPHSKTPCPARRFFIFWKKSSHDWRDVTAYTEYILGPTQVLLCSKCLHLTTRPRPSITN